MEGRSIWPARISASRRCPSRSGSDGFRVAGDTAVTTVPIHRQPAIRALADSTGGSGSVLHGRDSVSANSCDRYRSHRSGPRSVTTDEYRRRVRGVGVLAARSEHDDEARSGSYGAFHPDTNAAVAHDRERPGAALRRRRDWRPRVQVLVASGLVDCTICQESGVRALGRPSALSWNPQATAPAAVGAEGRRRCACGHAADASAAVPADPSRARPSRASAASPGCRRGVGR